MGASPATRVVTKIPIVCRYQVGRVEWESWVLDPSHRDLVSELIGAGGTKPERVKGLPIVRIDIRSSSVPHGLRRRISDRYRGWTLFEIPEWISEKEDDLFDENH